MKRFLKRMFLCVSLQFTDIKNMNIQMNEVNRMASYTINTKMISIILV